MADADARVAAGLEAWLAERGRPASVTLRGRATVGLSQETWFVEIDTGDGPADAVLRLPTPASGDRAIVTQRSALEAVAGRVPAPALLWSDDGHDNPFGRPFLVMERLAGEVPVGWHAVRRPQRDRLAEHAVDALAALHAVAATPPADPRPTPTELGFYTRRLERFAPLPAVLSAGLWWLERHDPGRPPRSVLVHGDFRMGNLMVDGERIVGVLDWEMAAPGDPVADLAWCFIPLWALPEVDEPALVRRYGERTGTAVEPERLRFHRILGYVRLAFYALSGTTAFAAGHSDDFRLAALALQLPVHLDRLAAEMAGEPVT